MSKEPQNQEQKPKAKAKTKAKKQYWLRTTYVKGDGVHAVGSEVTKNAMTAWKKNTDVPIDAYIGDAPPEVPKTDTEKLAGYDDLKKE